MHRAVFHSSYNGGKRFVATLSGPKATKHDDNAEVSKRQCVNNENNE